MSMVAQIMQGIEIAKKNLGDLLLTATLRHQTGSTYLSGTYTPATVDVPVQLVIDQFTKEDRERQDFQETDIKVSVFNNADQTLEVDYKDKILLNGVLYNIQVLNPAFVGNVKALFELVLRK
jgi:hypothetical protein